MPRVPPQQGKRWKREHTYIMWHQAEVLKLWPDSSSFALLGREVKSVKEHLRHLRDDRHHVAVHMRKFFARYKGVDPTPRPQASQSAVPHTASEQDLNGLRDKLHER